MKIKTKEVNKEGAKEKGSQGFLAKNSNYSTDKSFSHHF